jgi:PAS domain S-box-containing protein
MNIRQSKQKFLSDSAIQEGIKHELELAEITYRNLFEESPYAIILGNSQGKIIECNSKALKLSGYQKNEVIGKDFRDFPIFSPEDFGMAMSEFVNLIKGEKPQPRAFNIFKKDGTRVWVLSTVLIVKYNSEPLYQIILQDISERKIAEQRLKESEEKYRKLIEDTIVGVWVIDSGFKITLVNPYLANMFGYNIEEMIGKSLFSFMTEENTFIANQNLKKQQEGTAHIDMKFEFLHRNGTPIYTQLRASTIFDESDNFDGAFAFIIDITDKKKAEEILIESEVRFRALVETTCDWIWEIDENGYFTYSSPKIKDLLGYDPEEIIGKIPFDFMAINQFEKLKETYLTTFRSQKPYSGLINKCYHKNGEILYLETSGVPIFDDEGKFNGFRGIDRDISKRIKSNQKLRKSEEKYRLITENANDLIAVLNEKFEYEYINEQVYWNILGYNEEDLIGKVKLDLIHPDDQKQTTLALSKILRKGKGTHQTRIKTRDGSFKWLEVTAKNFFDSQGIKKILEISRDITDRKNIEKSLQKSEQKFRNIVDSIPLGMHMYQVNSDGNLIFTGANTSADKILNLDNSQFIGKTIENAFPPLKETDIPDRYREAALSGKSSTWDQVTYEDEKIKGAYEVHAFQTSSKSMVASFADITERLETERNLRESEEMFRTIAEQSFMGIGIIQEDKVIYANEVIAKILEYSLDEIMIWTKYNNILNMVHPEDLQMLIEQRRRRRTGDIDVKPNISYRIITKSGRIKWIDQYSKIIIYHGKEAELISIIDITEKKHAEEIILQENLKLMELNKMREDLITRVSHELKTPLTSIYGASQVILNQFKEELNKTVLNFVEISHRGGIRLKKLIENLIDTSKLKSGKLILNLTDEDLVAVVNECVEEMAFLAQNRNIIINRDLQNKVFLHVDKLRLEQAITNILSNAIKNTPSQGKIYISIIETMNTVDINIKDTGIGITLEEKKLLFKKFGKIERYGMDLGVDIEGAGLGLYISKEIVELHGGQIIVESEGRNEGTEVIIKLLK